jgi:hypothetical protein
VDVFFNLRISINQVHRCSVAPFARHEESIQSKVFQATATSLGLKAPPPSIIIRKARSLRNVKPRDTSRSGPIGYYINLALVSRLLPLYLAEDGWMLANQAPLKFHD